MSMDLNQKTALVTGASSGIGREIARQLAGEVSTLILMARRRELLDELAAELKDKRPSLRVLVRAVDLTSRASLGAVLDELVGAGERIDVLINNAGLGDFEFFDRSAWPKIEHMLDLNVVGGTYLLHRLIPGMVERGFGAILNVSSSSGMIASPKMGVYAATKAYINMLSDGIRAELIGTGVSITALCPGPVPTEWQEAAGIHEQLMPKLFYVEADACAREALDALKQRRARVVPGLPMHAVILAFEAMPRALMRAMLALMASRERQTH